MKFENLLSYIFSIIAFTVLMTFEMNAQITPPTILPGNMNMVVEKYVRIPDFVGTRPLINSIDYYENRTFVSETVGGYIFEMFENAATGQNTAYVFFDVKTAMLQATGRNLNLSNTTHGGFQDFAFHPDFATNGKIYTSVMEDRPANPAAHNYLSDVPNPIDADGVLIEWTYNHTTNTVDTNSYREVFRVGMPVYDHAIKNIVFNHFAVPGDEDYGLIYVAHGDGSVKSAIAGGGQNNDGLGKIIRINPLQSGANPYSIPPTNPFIRNAQYSDEFYAIGFRNPHNLSFNKDLSGNVHLISTEPGRDNIEEVNIIKAGENYGWSEREGTYVHIKSGGGLINGIAPLPANDADFNYTYPTAQWIHTGPVGAGFVGQAIGGGHNYTDASKNINHCVFGDFPVSGRVFYCNLSELVNSKTKLSAGESPEALTQAQIYEYNLWFDNDNDPNTPYVSRENMLDIINDEATYTGQRADIRFGNDSRGNLYISSKQNGWVYRVQEIFADNNSAPNITINDVSVDENAASAVLTVNLSQVANQNVTLNFSTANGSATEASDYTAVNGSLTIPTGQTTATISVPILEDNLDEQDETFTVNLTNAVGATITDAQAVVTIFDNDSPTSSCDAQIEINDRTITVNNIAAPINSVRILDQSWNAIDDCISWEGNDCGNSYSYTVAAAGTYIVQISTYTDWNNPVCDILETIVITGGTTVDCPLLNANIGDICDDNNAATTDDTVHNDCTCSGTDISIGNCDAQIEINGRTITVNNIAAPINSVRILDQSWNTINDCISWEGNDCGNSYSYTVAAAGTYIVQISTYSDWNNPVCDILETIVITGGTTVDCPLLNANIGDSCDDNNAATTDDTVQNDCTCSGTDISIGNCDPQIEINGQTITVNNIAAPISLVKVHDQSWNVLSECSPWTTTTCGNTFTYTAPAAGNYIVQILTFTDWDNQICDIVETVVISSTPNSCNNITNGGMITGDATICPDEIPEALTNINLPSGGTGTIEYRWLSSTTNCPTALSQTIAGANQSTYQPEALSQTTYFRRLSRRVGCTTDTDWMAGESNCIVITVEDNGDCGNQSGECNTNYSVTGNTININNLTDNIRTVKILDSNWAPIFTCDPWTTPCNSSESITVPSSGAYWVQIQTMEDWNTPICNILESVNIGNNARSAFSITSKEIAKTNAISFNQAGNLNDNVEDFHLFPNPAQDIINVKLQGFEGKNATLKLINLFGKELKVVRLENISKGTFQMPLNLKNGFYTLSIHSESKKPIVKKFLIKKAF